MPTHHIFTTASLDRCLQMAPIDAWFETLIVPPPDERWRVAAVPREDCIFVVHADDQMTSPRIVLIASEATPVSSLGTGSLHAAYQRIHRVAIGAANPPLRRPPAWTAFRHENLLAFFATPHGVDAPGLRWLVEIHPQRSRDICFWRLTPPDDPVRLESYEPPHSLYQEIVEQWPGAFQQAIRELTESLPVSGVGTVALEPTIDFEATTFGPVTQNRTYSGWRDKLTVEQQCFLDWPPDRSVKLRGPAGSGKTLALELKTLHELYDARRKGRDIRILFATHSWSVAEQVDDALRSLDETGGVPEIDIYPLLEIARDRVPVERRRESAVELLGEDSLSGRRLQLRRLDGLLDRLVRGDWLTYRRDVSDTFAARVEAPDGSADRRALLWDLTVEFSSVLGAERILPGANGERRYLGLIRYDWMMPLNQEAERRFVFQVYSEYIAGLTQDKLLTVDQLISDYLGYLETFSWNLLREADGYDLVFVDELHLFTEQERLALSYVTRPASDFPKLFMALDPRQSPSEVYAGVPAAVVARGDSGRADSDLGKIGSVELSRVHRFTPEILKLVQHIHRSYPALDLGPDWQVDLEAVQSAAGHGAKPSVFVHDNQSEEISAVGNRVDALLSATTANQRLAVVVMDPFQLTTYADELRRKKNLRVSIIQSRDDVGTVLRYSRRSLIIGAVEYLAGLQFDYIVIAGLPAVGITAGVSGYHLRRTLTQLYLAVSRATRHVELHVNIEGGGLPKVLEDAVAAGVVDQSS
jgi:hypothetical protein